MSLFPIASDKAQLTTAAVDAGDCYVQGLRLNSLGTLCRAALAGGAQYSNGLLLSNDGQVIYVDATAGLPADVTFHNGLPFNAAGALCISTDAAAGYSNGLPFAANGALSAEVLSLNLDFVSAETLDAAVTFTRASGATRTNRLGVLELMGTDAPRFDYDPVTLAPKGLLIEEQRTNSIRNSTGVGAVVGAPGTTPTNWSIVSGGGISRQIVSTGTEAGISYIDVRFFGTGSSVSAQRVYLESTATVSAATGQSWALSAYAKLVSGTAPAGLFIGFDETGPGTAYIRTDQASLSFTDALLRYTYSVALTGGANVAFILPQIGFNSAVGVAVDFTLRIGLPQLELGAFATSAIPTTTAAATRAADVAVMTGANFSNWYSQSEGTLFADASFLSAVGAQSFLAQIAGDSGNYIAMYRDSSTQRLTGRVRSGAVDQAFMYATASGVVGSTAYKQALAYKVDDFATTANGAAASIDTSGAVPASMATLGIGRATYTDSVQLNGHIRRISYFPRRLSNSELEGITK